MTIDLVAESTTAGTTAFQITVSGGNGTPVDNATLDVKDNMTRAGMTPVLSEGIEDGQEGVYTAPFEWMMAGDWIVTGVATLPDGQSVYRQFELSVSGDMEGMSGQ